MRACLALAAIGLMAGVSGAQDLGDLAETLPNPFPNGGDQFGYSVAAVGGTIVIGAPFDDVPSITNVGAVYVYDAGTGSLLLSIPNPAPASNDNFGQVVTAFGDDILVGAPMDNPVIGGVTRADAGAVYLFDGATGALLRTFTHPAGLAFDQFGFSIAAAGSSVIVGSPLREAGGTDAGEVLVFDGSTGALLRTLANPTAAKANDWFGWAVCASGEAIAVSATRDDLGATNAGTVFVFDGGTGALLRTIANPAPQADDGFGHRIADVGGQLLVGAPLDNPGGVVDAGTVYLFDGATGALVRTFSNPAPTASDQFGFSIAAVGGGHFLAGAPGEDLPGLDNTGIAYLIDSATGDLLETLNNPAPTRNDKFGAAVAALGTTWLVVSAPEDDNAVRVDEGAVYVFGGFPDNRPPTADAGPDRTLSAGADCQVAVLLEGTGSDPDGNSLAFTWTGPFGSAAGPAALVTLPLGTHAVTLTVDDGKGGTASDTAEITVADTTPPSIAAPGPVVAEQATLAGAVVALPDPTVFDNCGGVTVTHDAPAVFPLGATVVTFTATDAAGNVASATTTVTVIDSTPPAITDLAATPNALGPPNHKMIPVALTATASDICDAAPACRIVGVESNEPANGGGDGNTAPDWEITGDMTLDLRAERSGNGGGRVYTITVRCTDASGNSSTGQVTVAVPHDRGKK